MLIMDDTDLLIDLIFININIKFETCLLYIFEVRKHVHMKLFVKQK